MNEALSGMHREAHTVTRMTHMLFTLRKLTFYCG